MPLTDADFDYVSRDVYARLAAVERKVLRLENAVHRMSHTLSALVRQIQEHKNHLHLLKTKGEDA